MGPETIALITAVVSLVGYVVKLYAAQSKSTTRASEQARLADVAEMAVAAAEEYAANGKLTPEDKGAYAAKLIRAGFPNLDADTLDAAIHSALVVLEIGAAEAAKK